MVVHFMLVSRKAIAAVPLRYVEGVASAAAERPGSPGRRQRHWMHR